MESDNQAAAEESASSEGNLQTAETEMASNEPSIRQQNELVEAGEVGVSADSMDFTTDNVQEEIIAPPSPEIDSDSSQSPSPVLEDDVLYNDNDDDNFEVEMQPVPDNAIDWAEEDSDEGMIFDAVVPPHIMEEVNALIPDDPLVGASPEMFNAIHDLVENDGGPYFPERHEIRQQLRRALFSMNRRGQSASADADAEDNVEDANEQDVSNEQAEEDMSNSVRFDTNLPAEHSYLGGNMNRVSGVNYLDVGTSHQLLLFMHYHILFPGEVLPFMTAGAITEEDIDANNGFLFGICFPALCENQTYYGVTCQVYEKGSDERGNLLIKSRALQRFVAKAKDFSGPLSFIAAHRQPKVYGTIKALPEIYLPEPLKCINMGSMNRFRDNASMQTTFRRFQAASTPWPAHVYNDYEFSETIVKARQRLTQHKIETMPTDPTQLSFWLVRNLLMQEKMVKSIFMTDSVNVRMKLISTAFKGVDIFICRYCGNRIANCTELFAMSKHGVQSQYCNSAGYIHETNTVYKLLRHAISYSGSPSSEFSWFPGYQWHIIICKVCSRHLGWEFKAIEQNLVPKIFFGLSSSSVRVSSDQVEPRDARTVLYQSLLQLVSHNMQ